MRWLETVPQLPLKVRVAHPRAQAPESRDEWQHNFLSLTIKPEDGALGRQRVALVVRPEDQAEDGLRRSRNRLQAEITLRGADQQADLFIDVSVGQNADRITKPFEKQETLS